MKENEILLESGTNEVEIIVFNVGDNLFGINVLKVREIINPIQITNVPKAHEYVEGIINLREDIIPLINLSRVLNIPPSKTPEHDKFIVAEMNEMKIAFRVHNIKRIYRLSWSDIEKPDELSNVEQTYAIGYSEIEEEMVILIDFEKIIVEINPELGVTQDELTQLGQRERSEKTILIAEDSAVLRQLLQDTLQEAGYNQLKLFENGRDAWEFLQQLAQEKGTDSQDDIQLVITDIEMPQMDGHHLTENIKQDRHLQNIPVIIFSSLITKDLFHKGESVGANAQVTKPQLVHLVDTIDAHIL
ncbi:MAG TPA: chemotaxis protein [Bacillota bacterium]|nr:chemotaxis protein [Bacillota bacterium]